MPTRNFSVRLTAEGGVQLVNVLKDAAASSAEAEAALKALTQASPQLASVADGVQVKLGQVAAKLKDVTASASASATATEQLAQVQRQIDQMTGVSQGTDYAARAADVAAYGAALDALRAKISPVFAATRQYSAALAEIDQAQRTGAASAQEIADAQTRVQAAYRQSVASIQQAVAAEAAAVEASNRQLLGISEPTSASDYAKRAADVEAYGASLDALRAKYNPVYAASRQYETALAEIDQAQKAGAISAQEAATAQSRATEAFAAANAPLNENAKALHGHGMASNGASLATYDLTKAVLELGSGMPVSMVVMQHAGQAMYIYGEQFIVAKNAVVAFAGSITGMATIAGGVAVLALGALELWSDHVVSKQLALQSSLRATRDDYAAMAQEVQSAARIVAHGGIFSTGDAQSAAQAFAAQPNFVGTTDQLAELVKVAGDAATELGVKLPQEAQALAPALEDAGKVAQELADKHLFGMNEALAESIKQMQAAQGNGAAFNALMDSIKAHTKDAAENALTPLEKGLHDLENSFSSAPAGRSWWQNLAENANSFGGQALSVLAALNRGASSIGNFIGGQGYALGLPPDTAGIMQGIASRSQMPSDILSFAMRVAAQESGGRQYTSNGNLMVSPAGAMGVMGLMPGTAADLGVNPANEQQNILGGLTYITELWKKYNGDPTLVAMAFNWGPGNVDAFLAGRKTLAQVPAETYGYVSAVVPGGPGIASTLSTAINVSGAYGAKAGVDVQAAYKQALGAGGTTVDAQKAQQAIETYDAALAQAGRTGELTAQQMSVLRDQLQKQQAALYNAVSPLQAFDRTTQQQIDYQGQLTKAYQDGPDAVAQLMAHEAALNDLRSMKITPNLNTYAAALQHATQMELAKQAGVANDNVSKFVSDTDRQTAAQLKINAAYDGTQLSLTHAENAAKAWEQTVNGGQGLTPGMAGFQAAVDAATTSLDQHTASMVALQQEQSSVQALTGTLSSAFDQLGQGIVNAFLSGSGQAVNFGNIMRSVIGSIISEIAKLAIINPVINSLFGQANPTLGLALGALGNAGGGGSSSASGGGLFGSLSNVFSLGQISDTLGLTNIGSSLSGIGSSLGLTGNGGLFSGLGSGLSGLLGSPTNAALSGLGSGVYGPATAAQVGAAGTLGQFAGGIGLGFTAGDMLGGFLQSSMGKVGPAPMIGAGLGAGAGALAGTFLFPGVGTVLGGLIGGLIGGGGGGLIGPKKATPYSSEYINIGANGLSLGNVGSQLVDTTQEVQAAQQGIAQVNAILSAFNLDIASIALPGGGTSGPGGRFQLGQALGGADKFASLTDAFPSLRFHASNDNTLNTYLQGKSYSDAQALQTDVTNYLTLINTTIPALTSLTKTTGSYQQQVDSLNTQFGAAITTANQYGVATDALVAGQKKAVDQVFADINKQTGLNDAGYVASYMSAQATITGNPQDALNAQLNAFDLQAQQARDALTQQLVGWWGDGIKGTSAFADQMTALDRSLNEQRLAIQTQYNNQLAAAAENAVSGIGTWLQQFAQGSSSPLNDNAKLTLAANQFNTDSTAALTGDTTAIQALTGDASAYIAAGRSVYGSGTGYVAIADAVTSKLGQVAQLPSDVLTAGVMGSLFRTQTQQLSDGLAAVVKAVNDVRAQLKLTPLPSRVAA